MPSDLLISADSHIFEPGDLWTRKLSQKWGDDLPHRVKGRPGESGNWDYDYTGEEYFRCFPHTTAKEFAAAGWDPDLRMRCMQEDGIWAELIGPSNAMPLLRVGKYEMVKDCIAVYNDWLRDYCSTSPQRLLRCAIIQMADVDWAVMQLEQAAKEGVRCVFINADTRPDWPPYRDKVYDRFWARAEEMDMPVQLHILTGIKPHPLMLREKDFGNMPRLHLDFANDIGLVLATEFIFGGIFDRFPNLKVVIGEYEVSWVPFWMFRVEQLNDSFGPEYAMPKAKRRPRDYLSQIYFGVVDDPYVKHVDGLVSADNMLWGSDFPHTRNTFPNSLAVAKRTFSHLGGVDLQKVLAANAMKLFKIEAPAMA